MIKCPACETENLPGTFFCVDCGSSFLPSRMRETTASLGAATMAGGSGNLVIPPPAPPRDTAIPVLRVVILNSGRKLGFNTNQPIVIGRQDSKGSFYPDIDLSTDGGLEAGVSRRHAIIRIQSGNVCTLEDLGSSNGTFINREKLTANSPKALRHGDEVRLGNILLRIELTSQ